MKKKSKTFFLAIHKNERQIFIEDKNNNSFLKTIYLYLHRCFLLNLRVLKNKFSFDEKQTLFVTASKHHSPAAGATQGYGVYLRNVMHKHATAPGQQTIMWDDTFLELYPTFP